ncbi:MAG: ABC transporter permease [Lachnospiraceae bacterium]|nr:ABC transporter permease [Lachnospiraceae bacterium]
MAERSKMHGPRVNNKKLIRKLALKTVKANSRKNIVIIAAIALCTFMFTSLFTIGLSLVSKFQESTQRQSGGSSDASFKYLTEAEYDAIAADTSLKQVSKRIYVGDAVGDELLKLHTEVCCCDETNAHESFCYPEAGHLPMEEDEAVFSSLVLKAFGMKAETFSDYESLLGKSISLQIDGKDGAAEHDLKISGIYTGDRISQAQMVLVSEAFQEKYAPTPTESYYGDNSMRVSGDIYGRISADVDFHIPFNISGQVYDVIQRDGLPEDVNTGINWASATGSVDFTSLILMASLLLTIFISGYLIINNIYRINVYADIRSYGLLKTIGTSSRQLKSLVKWQAVYHCIPGILLGLFSGMCAGALLLPLVMSSLNFSDTTDTGIKFGIWIPLFSALFSYITVRISVGRAIKFASKVSPMEALRYSENAGFKKRCSKGSHAFDTMRFAARNVFRERKRCFFVVLSLALSMVVLNSVYTLVKGFDENKYVEHFIKTDFSVADATTDNLSVAEKTYDGITDTFLSELQKQDGILDKGNIYAEQYSYQKLNDRDYERFSGRLLENDTVDTWMRDMMSVTDESGEMSMDKATIAKVYGMDDYAIRNLQFIHGEYDEEKFRTGKYIIVNEYDTGSDTVSDFIPYFMPGETVQVNNNDGEVREYEVMATVNIPYAMRIQYYVDMDVAYVLPSEEFLDFFGDRSPMRTLFDTTDEAEPAIERWLQDYTGNIEKTLTYTSREVYKKEFAGFTGMFKVVGGLLTGVLALIGILNLVNTLVSSIISRRLELAMLEAVGMTKSMQRRIIRFEGVIYGVLSALLGTLLSTVFSMVLVRGIGAEMWFYTYRFTLIPVAFIVPVMIIVAVIIPDIIYRNAMKETVVERLRIVE